MRMKEEVRQAFSTQMNREYYSAFLYLQMSDWLNQNNWPGSAYWMYVQYKEELAHAQGIFEYLQYRGVEVNIDKIAKPEQQEWESVLAVFESALAHEQQITTWINEVVDIAADAGDKAAVLFLDWYVVEQVEEEANQENNIDNIKAGEGMAGSLRVWDKHMGKREFSGEAIPMPG